MAEDGTPPLPKDPLLADAARAFDHTKQWVWVVDAQWQLVSISHELRASFGYDVPLPTPFLGEAWLSAQMSNRFGSNTLGQAGEIAAGVGGLMLDDVGPAGVRALVDPRLRDTVLQQPREDAGVFSFTFTGTGAAGIESRASGTAIRLRDAHGRLAGTAIVTRPALGDGTLASLTMHADPDHLARMRQVERVARRPAAILFADLEGSSALARRLPTAKYFQLARRLVRAADHEVVAAGGLVGRHVGDGLAAFFLAETAKSESAAAQACIAAARGFRTAVLEVAERSDLDPSDVVVRMGLHWGATLYVGNIITEGRSEVTALGDEVNVAARIEASAAGGLSLATKDLIERLNHDDAAKLGIETDRVVFTPIGELATATEKAQRDAPTIAVCEI